jgi:transposase-like protein
MEEKESTVAENLPPGQVAFLGYLLRGASIRAAAKEIGIGERTARRWVATDRFRKALRAAEQAAVEDTVRRLTASGDLAVSTLQRLCSPDNPATVSRAAAADLLSIAPRLRAMSDLEERLRELEALVNGSED